MSTIDITAKAVLLGKKSLGDTFGEGMRAAKEQVAAILASMGEP